MADLLPGGHPGPGDAGAGAPRRGHVAGLAAALPDIRGTRGKARSLYSPAYSYLGCFIAIQLREVQNSPESDAVAT